jgi:succinyl-diaminopimelate desuccinylase
MEDLIGIISKLVGFRSTQQQPEQQKACADFIASYFDDTTYEVKRFFHEGVHSLVITQPGVVAPKVFLVGHFDVVEGRDDQFIPKIDGDRLYGRGALDMKSGVAVMMTLLKELGGSSADVGLMLTGDEELGGFAGVAHLLSLGYSCEVAVLPDGGEAVHRVVTKEKGVLKVTLEARGVAAHGSKPWNGDNAIMKLYGALDAVHALFRHPELAEWVSTLNVGKIEGGKAFNQVPDYAAAHCDIRYVETDQPLLLVEKIRDVLPTGVTVKVDMNEPMTVTDIEHPLVKKFIDCLALVGRKVDFAVDHGSSDGRFFSAMGVPVIISQPDGAGLHGPDEWVSVSAVEDYYTVLGEYIHKIAL